MSPEGCARERLGAGACEPVSLLTPSLILMDRLPPLSALAAGPDPAGAAPDSAGCMRPLAAGPISDTYAFGWSYCNEYNDKDIVHCVNSNYMRW